MSINDMHIVKTLFCIAVDVNTNIQRTLDWFFQLFNLPILAVTEARKMCWHLFGTQKSIAIFNPLQRRL